MIESNLPTGSNLGIGQVTNLDFTTTTMAEEQTAVAEPDVEIKSKKRAKPDKTKPKRLPPYAVIVENDDLHTFDYVMQTFQKVFGYNIEKCFLLAYQIHTQGQALVWSGSKEVAELKVDLIRSAGPDFYASKPVEFPLGVRMEPMP